MLYVKATPPRWSGEIQFVSKGTFEGSAKRAPRVVVLYEECKGGGGWATACPEKAICIGRKTHPTNGNSRAFVLSTGSVTG